MKFLYKGIIWPYPQNYKNTYPWSSNPTSRNFVYRHSHTCEMVCVPCYCDINYAIESVETTYTPQAIQFDKLWHVCSWDCKVEQRVRSIHLAFTGFFLCVRHCSRCWRNKGEQNSQKSSHCGGAWVSQSAKHLTLDFDSGHELMVHKLKPHIGLCADSGACLGLSLSAPPLLFLSLPKINK